jgi:predicted membrane metal-binding protein
MILVAILVPGLSFLLRGKLISALAALILQVIAVFTSLVFGIGFMLWLILAIWAVVSYQNAKTARRHKEMLKAIRHQQGNNN